MEIQTFTAPEGQTIRTIIKHGEPWFVAADACKILDVDRTSLERLDDDEKGVDSIHTLGGQQNATILSEAGLYSLILGSRKPEAKVFKRWVTHEVLPKIRKTGAYYPIPQSYADALRLAADQQDTIQAQALQIEAAKPAVEFVARFVDNATTQPLRAVAKVLKVNERAFVAKLVDEGILYRLAGKLTPAARHMDTGRFEVKEIVAKNGHATTQMRFTTKGVEWIAGKVQEWAI